MKACKQCGGPIVPTPKPYPIVVVDLVLPDAVYCGLACGMVAAGNLHPRWAGWRKGKPLPPHYLACAIDDKPDPWPPVYERPKRPPLRLVPTGVVPASWTPADQAELDVLVHEIVIRFETHRATCDEQPCPHLQAAIAEVVEWKQARELLSRAEALRAERRALEEAA